MSREFEKDIGGGKAHWYRDGSGVSAPFGMALATKDIPALITWLQEGPPKKRYRITRTFNFAPQIVSKWPGPSADITDDDIEEVWE